jgi:HEAT repeat protein
VKSNITLTALLALAAWLASPAAPLHAQSAEDGLIEVLGSNAPAHDKCNACRELKTVGTEKSIPALAALLGNAEVSHTARIALESMPYPAAGAALRDALGKTTGLVKSGIVDSIGERRDAGAVPLLAPVLADGDVQVVAAAALALGKIGTPEAASALSAARAKARDQARLAISKGLLYCADRLQRAGERDRAAKVYEELSQPDEPRAVRAAALHGLMQTSGRASASKIIEWLTSDDALVRRAAAARLRDVSDVDLRAVASSFAKLPPVGQASALAAIRIRGDRSLVPVALEAAQSEDAGVRLAAARALGIVGDVLALPVLIELSKEPGALGQTASTSLEIVCGPQIDKRIAGLLAAEKEPARRAGWIALVEARRPEGATSLLLKEAVHSSAAVRARAMEALAKLAGPGDVPAMTAAVLVAEQGAERDNAEKAVMLVCGQIADAAKRADPALAVFDKSNAQQRAALLPLLGRIGGPAAKQRIDAALAGGDAALYESAVRALCNWPDASVAEQLLDLSRTGKADRHRLWALRAFIRVSALPDGASDAQRLDMLQRAMKLATRDEERRLILERASAVRTVESLRFLLGYLDRPALAPAAGDSIVELARHTGLRDPNKAEFVPALNKVLATSKDAGTLDRARRYLEAAGAP